MNKDFVKNAAINAVGMISGALLAMRGYLLAGGVLMGAGFMGLVETFRRYKPTTPERRLRRDSKAVSPVIGVILMVAITVVLAAIVFVLVQNLGLNETERMPILEMTSDGHGNFTVLSVSHNLRWSDLLIGPGTTCIPTPSGPTVEGGDTISCSADRLTVVHRPSHTVIFDH